MVVVHNGCMLQLPIAITPWDKLAVIERWPDYRVQFQQFSTLWGTAIWLLYKG